MKLFFLIFLFPLFLRGDWDVSFPGDEDPCLFQHVHVISGQLTLTLQDAVVGGASFFPLTRTYSSRHPGKDTNLKNVRGGWMVQGGGWNFLPHLFLKLSEDLVSLPEPSGQKIVYQLTKFGDYRPLEGRGQSYGRLGGKFDAQNNILCKQGAEFLLKLPNGGYRLYKKTNKEDIWHLVLERLPSGYKIFYLYDEKGRLVHIDLKNPSESKNYSWVHFDDKSQEGESIFTVKTSDGKTLRYSALLSQGKDYLHHVQGPIRSDERFGYTDGTEEVAPRVCNMHWAGALEFNILYEGDKVKTLQAPVGENGKMVSIGEFSYKENFTDVKDSEGALIRYHHLNQVIEKIEYFDLEGKFYSALRFIWQGGRLCAKVLCSQDGPIFSKTFVYDEKGNVVQETLWGKITGEKLSAFSLNQDGSLQGAESVTKIYGYDRERNLLIYEKDGEVSYRYKYKEGTDLLTARYTYNQERMVSREFFFYDEDHLLIQEIVDDGVEEKPESLKSVTLRRGKKYTVHPDLGIRTGSMDFYLDPISYQEIPLNSSTYLYNDQLLVTQELVYDQTGVHRYTIYTEYDEAGRILSKTTPLGQVNRYLYDRRGDLIEAKEVGSGFKKLIRDEGHRLYALHQGDKNIKQFYDTKGRLLSKKEADNRVIEQEYDAFGRCIKTRFPEVLDEQGLSYRPVIDFSYDIQGNLISYTTPKGETTLKEYNLFRKPIRVVSSMKEEVRYRYNLKGSLLGIRYLDDTRVEYEYDSFERLIRKQVWQKDLILSEERWTYNAFCLLTYTDEKGLTTTFFYDGAGRKIKEQAENRQVTYEYDALGFLEKVHKKDITEITLCDVEGKIRKKWEEKGGVRENYVEFFYKDEGSLEKISQSLAESSDHFTYDDEGRLVQKIDKAGFLTTYKYEGAHKKKTIDALGCEHTDLIDDLGRLVMQEKKDKKGHILAREEFFYDRSGNQVKRVNHVYAEGRFLGTRTLSLEYDAEGRVTKQVEEDGKVSLFSYDIRGRLIKKILPNQVYLSYVYDGLGRLSELKSSDGTVHYRYGYQKGRQPTLVQDLICQTQVIRKYNVFGEVEEETLSSGLRLNFSYDDLGRQIKLTLPDFSFITYTYENGRLCFISRFDEKGNFLYRHAYTVFDLKGKVLEEDLIHSLGKQITTYDSLGRPVAQTSPYMTQQISYGPLNFVQETKNSLLGEAQYTYDSLGQLKDKGKVQFDSLGNSLLCRINRNNQIVATKESKLSYDKNGNVIRVDKGKKSIFYEYDALGRLTSIVLPKERKIIYGYDPFSRLMAKEEFDWQEGEFIQKEKTSFLYNGAKEIGSANLSGIIKELRVLGVGLGGEVGAAVAIELGREVFAPLHDFMGNIIALVSVQGDVVESYKFDAFGGQKMEIIPKNPWRFCSKRHEEDLVCFGSRFYDPNLGRWLTPDPSGFVDGPNLYAYARNNPVNRLDVFGLSSFSKNTSLEIPLNAIEKGGLIACKGVMDGVSMDCFVSCGFLHQLQYSPEEIKVGKIDLFDHFAEILPSTGRRIGLITLENGINTPFHEFEEMSASIINKIEEGTLFIGMHTPTTGFFSDLLRSARERSYYVTPVVAQTAQMMSAIIDKLHAINPDLVWVDIRHSEGGVIGRRAIELLSKEERHKLQKQMYTLTIGSAMPIPCDYGLQVHNIYSEADYFTSAFSFLLPSSSYNIEIIPCSSSWSDRVLFADHAFIAPTYQDAIDESLLFLRQVYGFYKPNF